jgi:hypothetical protein
VRGSVLWKVLKVSDVTFVPTIAEPRFALISLGDTKTTHMSNEAAESLVVCTCKLGLCALHLLRKYVDCCCPDKSADLFRWSNGRRLIRDDMKALVAGVVRFIGWAPGDLGTHSFRSGGATTWFELGVPLSLVKWLGRWALQGDTLEKHYVKPRQAANASWLSLMLQAVEPTSAGFFCAPSLVAALGACLKLG